jgi:hypothetical protein
VDGTRADNLLDEGQAVLRHVLGGWAQGVGVDVAERVADDQVGMAAAQGAVVRQHDPGLDLEPFRGELTAGVAEGVAVRIPCRKRGDETMAAPCLVPDGHIARGMVRLEDPAVGVQGGWPLGWRGSWPRPPPRPGQAWPRGRRGRVPDTVPGIPVPD